MTTHIYYPSMYIYIKREREREREREEEEEVVQKNEHDNSKPLVIEGVNHQSLVATSGKRLKSLQSPLFPVGTMDTIYLHIGMILSTLGLSPYGFAFGLYPKRPHTNEDICPSLYTHDPPHF